MGRNVAIQHLRGPAANMPVLDDAEFYFAEDQGRLYVGYAGINFQLGVPFMANISIQGNAFPTHFLEPNADGSINIAAASPLAVTGTFFQATQPVSIAASIPLPTGASSAANQATEIASLASIDSKTPALVSGRQPVDGSAVTQPVSIAATVPVQEVSAATAVTAVGTSGAAVTLTLPAVAGQFHYITLIEIVKYAAAALTGSATPVTVTSTNLPGTPAFTMGTAAAIGTTERIFFTPNKALKSSVVNTATTIVCPATTSVIWRVNVWYVAAP
jgi:hypothetical protein